MVSWGRTQLIAGGAGPGPVQPVSSIGCTRQTTHTCSDEPKEILFSFSPQSLHHRYHESACENDPQSWPALELQVSSVALGEPSISTLVSLNWLHPRIWPESPPEPSGLGRENQHICHVSQRVDTGPGEGRGVQNEEMQLLQALCLHSPSASGPERVTGSRISSACPGLLPEGC